MADFSTVTTMFFSLDAPDGNGKRADVQVTVGEALIEQISTPRGKKMAQVSFVPRDTKEQYPINGWVPNDGVLMPLLKEAQANDEPIQFRIESARKNTVDRSWTVDKKKSNQESKDPAAPPYVEGKERFKRIVGVAKHGSDDWVYDEGMILTNPGEDARFKNHGGSAFNMSLTELNPTAPRPAPANTGSQYGGYEAPVFRDFNQDGTLNLGGNGMIAALGTLSFVREHLHDQGIVLPEEKVLVLATNLVASVSHIQVGLYQSMGGNPTTPLLSAGSHTRIRGALFSVIKHVAPLTTEDVASGEALGEWGRRVTELTRQNVEWAVKTVEPRLKN